MRGRFLVVAATHAEAAYLPPDVPLVITGMGKTTAAVETTRALLEHGTDGLTVLNVGTAGALLPGLTGLYLPGVVVNHDLSADAIRALGAEPEERLELGTGDADVVLASGDLFVTDPARRDQLAAFADLVDMEAYGVALACRRLAVPVELVKHVSDNADESAFDWPAAVDASARALGAWVTERLGSTT